MRRNFQTHLEHRSLPLVMAHGGGLGHGRENSLEAIREALKYNPDIVEIDIRKSRDGVLYCHHGSIPFGVLAAQVFGFLPFTQTQRFIGKLDTLESVISIVPSTTDIYLDIKSSNITSADLQPLIVGRRNIWVTAYSISHLAKLRSGLGEGFVYVLNRPFAFVRLQDIIKLIGLVDVVYLFRWQWSHVLISEIESNGIACHLAHWFLDVDEQRAKMEATSPWKGIYVHYDDLSKVSR